MSCKAVAFDPANQVFFRIRYDIFSTAGLDSGAAWHGKSSCDLYSDPMLGNSRCDQLHEWVVFRKAKSFNQAVKTEVQPFVTIRSSSTQIVRLRFQLIQQTRFEGEPVVLDWM